ncbi:type II toxin-antitoxin system VapC family toxin [Candidatus Micrarchaeota archaeon]|nr:type II toxin-antitoxin system VapC family toxin [Candidatus Micrarchaeota archaeon]
MIIYDASAFFERIKEKNIDLNGFITSLTFYEVGNVVLKHSTILKEIGKEEAASFLKILSNWKNVLYPDQHELESVYGIALETKLTFYDAIYIHITRKYKAVLETCDKELYKKGKNHCKMKLLKP